jgi:WD40 repeat protein
VVRTLTGHSGIVFSLLFVSDNELLSGSAREIRSWDLNTGRLLREIPTHRSVTSLALSPDQRILAYAAIDRVVVLNKDAGKPMELQVPNASPSRVAFRPNSNGTLMLAATFGNSVVLYDAKTGKDLLVAEHLPTASIKAIAFSPDGKLLATCGTDVWKIWDVEAKSSKFRGQALGYGAAFSPDGKTFVVAGNDIEFWNLETGKRKQTLDIPNSLIESICYTPDGKLLIGGGYEAIKQTNGLEPSLKIFDAETGKEHAIHAARTNSLESIAISPDGKLLASGSGDKKIRIWNLSSGQVDQPLGDHESTVIDLAFSSDNQLLASTGLQEPVRFWDMTTRKEFIPGDKDSKAASKASSTKPTSTEQKSEGDDIAEKMISALGKLSDAIGKTNFGTPVFSPDGKKFATLESGNGLALRDVKTWQPIHKLAGHQSTIYTVAFSTDGKLLASGSDDGLTKIWSTETGKEVLTLSKHSMSVRTLAFSPDNTLLASGSNDKTIKLWEVNSGRLVRTLTGYPDYVRSVVFSSDGKKLVNGGLASKATVWDVATGRLVRTLTGHSTDVRAVVYSIDGKFLFTCSNDATIKVWRESDGAELATLILLGEGDWLVVTPDGLFDGSPVAWQQIVWRFGDTFKTAPVEAFFADFFYPGLLAEILKGKEPKAESSIAKKDIRQPEIKLSQAEAGTGANRSVNLRISVSEVPADSNYNSGSGAQDVRVFRNGSLVKTFRGDVLKGQKSVTLEATIPIVAGENRLTAYAFNRENIKTPDATLVVNGDKSLERKATLYLFAVGVNIYANRNYNLKYAVADATEFGAEVKLQQQSLQSFGRVEVISLRDSEATKANITRKLGELARIVQPEDTVIFYFAGHGTAHANQFYLIPHDLGYMGARDRLTEPGLATMLAHSISDRELERSFEAIDAGQLLMVIDACNSGQALEAEEKRRGPMNSKGLAQLAYEKGMYILTAAQSFQAAKEAARLGHGYLTYALVVEGLRNGAADEQPKDGTVIVREWLDYATKRVPLMQLEKMTAARGLGLGFSFVEGEARDLALEKKDVQRPRVFYRRELESKSFVIARPKVIGK